MGFAAAGPLPRHPPRRGRNPDADAASAAFHFEPSAGHLGAGVLVLDVGRAWRHPGCSIAGHGQDRL